MRSTEPLKLFKIGIAEWVLGTVERMRRTGSDDRTDWARCWYETYVELGGKSRDSGVKGCPRAAAYGLWYLGRLSRGGRPRLNWPVIRVVEELGKNPAYAVIAVELSKARPILSVDDAWRAVQLEFQRQTGEEPAISEQGEIKVALALSSEGHLI